MKQIKAHSIFFGLALGGILILFLFTYLAQQALINSVNARENVISFYKYNRYLTIGTFVVYFVLLLVANLMYIKQRYWDTFIWAAIIFSAFTIIDWWWLSETIFRYKKMNDLWLGEFSIGPFVGVMIALFGIVIAIGNYALLKRFVKEKNIQPNPPEIETNEEIKQ